MDILGSVTSLIAQLRWAHSDVVSTEEIGRYHAELYWRDLDGIAQRGPIEDCIHISFQDLNEKPVEQIQGLYEYFSIPITDDVLRAVKEKAAAASDSREVPHRYSFA